MYATKTLDQMVLDDLNNEEEIAEEIEEITTSSNENNENENNELEVKQIEISNNDFFFKNEITDLKIYFDNLQKIRSKTLQKQIVDVLENLQLNLERGKDKEIFFLIVDYFKSIGQINNSYEFIEKYNLTNDKNLNFYTGVKINDLLSTFQLNVACYFIDSLNSNV